MERKSCSLLLSHLHSRCLLFSFVFAYCLFSYVVEIQEGPTNKNVEKAINEGRNPNWEVHLMTGRAFYPSSFSCHSNPLASSRV